MFNAIDPIAAFLKDLRQSRDRLRFRGRFEVTIWDKGRCISKTPLKFNNATTNVGLDDILGVYLAGGTQKPLWYFGLVNNASFSAFAAGDTMASHAGWLESAAYGESVRQAWTPGAVSGQSVTNPVQATFTMNATVTIKGAFIVSNSTKSGSTGILWSTGAFSSPQALVNTQELKVTYTATASG